MSTAADNIATLTAYPIAAGDESVARQNVEKLRTLEPSDVVIQARRIFAHPQFENPGLLLANRLAGRTLTNYSIATS